MSESSLSIGLPNLQQEVGGYLGYGRTVASFSTAQAALVDSVITSGIRRVYYPPAIGQGDISHEWSFMRPVASLTMVVDDYDYDLPDDFGRLFGNFHFAADEHRSEIVQVSTADLLELRSMTSTSQQPQFCAVRYKATTGATGQRQEVLFHPTPDDTFVLTYEYEAYNGALSDSYPYPLGGMQLAELYIASCLAVAEVRLNDEAGPHTADYTRLLVDAINRDRKRGAKNFGQIGQQEGELAPRRVMGSDYEIEYKDVIY